MAREATKAIAMERRGGKDDDHVEDERLAPYAFVPAALRHDFWRDEDQAEITSQAAVEHARRTRSAHLVATLLYGEGNQRLDGIGNNKEELSHQAPRKGKTATSTRHGKATATVSVREKTTPSPATADLVATVPLLTSPLYSLSVELTMSKRMAFRNAVQQLDEYMNGLRKTVENLNATDRSGTTIPSWVWDSTTVKLPTTLQIQRKIVQTVASCLPDCDVYLAMYEPLPMATPATATVWPQLRYVAASSQSSMEGRILHREMSPLDEGKTSVAPSFTVLESLDPLLVPDVGDSATAAAMQWLGHDDDQAVRTGPFACLPLVGAHGVRGIGVLALDACRKAAKMRPEAMSPQALFEFLVRAELPEAAVEFRKLQFGGRQLLQLTANDLHHRPAYRSLKIQTKQRIMEIVAALRSGHPLHLPHGEQPAFFCDDDEALSFLDDICERAGSFIDEYSRDVHWHRVIAKRTRDVRANVLDVYAVLIEAIAHALTGVERVCVWKIREYTDIDAIGTTQLPDDRLQPFLQWNDRQIRRVPLYLENNDDQGRLMQGNVTRINLPPPLTQQGEFSPSSRPCERALYHVTWSNRTQQSFSWPQLRLILPIRPMNARHYQLSQLLKRLQSLRSGGKSSETSSHGIVRIRLTDPDALVMLLIDPHRGEDVMYAVQVDFLPQPEGTQHNQNSAHESDSEIVERFVQRAITITQQNLVCVRGREERSFGRQLSSVKTARNFTASGLNPSAEALRALDEIVTFVFNEIATNLPGTQQQVAELHSDGSHLRFTFAGNGSTLVGKTLNRGQGVSFRCIDSRIPLVVGVSSALRSRMKLLGANAAGVDADMPYVFLPLLYEDACVGVLSVNRFVDVSKGRADEDQPEEGVVEYLVSLSNTLAAAIYLKRRAYVLHTLQQLRLEPLRSPEQLFCATGKVLQDTIIGVWKMRAVEIDFERGKSTTVYEYSEAARLQAETHLVTKVIPLGFRVRELLPVTIATHWAISREDVDKLIDLWQQHEYEENLEHQTVLSNSRARSEMEKRKVWEWRVRRRYYRLELKPLEDDLDGPKRKETSSSAVQLSKAVAGRSPNQRYITQALGTSLGSKTVAFARVHALDIGNSSAVYLAVATQSQFFAACEQNFVDRVAETISRLTESLVHRVERSRKRVDALDELKLKCMTFVDQFEASLNCKPSKAGTFPLSPSGELQAEGLLELLGGVVRFISSLLECPSVYIALHEPFHRRLRYVAASPKSSMTGKILHRGHGVSFYELDNHQPLVITAANKLQVEKECGHSAKLRHFSSETDDSQKWPFMVVPIDSIGVLALHNLEYFAKLTSESQPELGLVDFLRRAAQFVGESIASVRSISRGVRQHRREEAVVRVMAACEDRGKRTNPLFLQQVVLQAIEGALNGVDVYIAIIQPLCSSMLFTSATPRSVMANQQVNTSDSVSFRVFLSQRPLVIPQLERKQFDTSESQTADLIHQLRWFTPSQDEGRRGPFVCIPIPFVGVLSVDTFPGGAGGIYSPHVPELGVVECLIAMANLLGQSIREITAAETMREIPKLFEGNRSTFRIVFARLLELIAKNVLTAVELAVVCYDEVSWVPVHGAESPLVSLVTSVEKHRSGSPTTISSLSESISETLRMGRTEQTRCWCLPDHPEVIILRSRSTRDVDSRGEGAVDWASSCRSLTTAIVIRRVHGATWTYDHEFLLALLPVIDEIVELINARVCGIASRQNAIHALESMCTELESMHSSADALKNIPRFLHDALCVIVQAASQIPGDAYMGERIIGGEHLEFVAASSDSLMKGARVDLLAAGNQDMVTISCLQRQQHLIVHLMDGTNAQLLRQLTTKKVQRMFAAFPTSAERLVCVDSLSIEAFDPIHLRLERDVASFLMESAALLETTISAVRYRYAYDQLCDLKSKRHKNLREFFATIHAILRRELTAVHSQQIMALADDFTGNFSVCSWHRSATRRVIRGSIRPHFCFVNGCTRDLITEDIHFEQHLSLPMTNVPRTLDQSRAVMEPVTGREKQGAYACECMSSMVDTGLRVTAKVALCVYSHDAVGEGSKPRDLASVGRPTAFTSRQRQFFFALSAVGSDVYLHVFRACVLETFGLESLFIARERLNARDAVLFSVGSSEDHSDQTVRVESSCLVPAAKWIPGSTINGKLAEKVRAFHEEWLASSVADFTIYVAKITSAARPRTTLTKVEVAVASSPATPVHDPKEAEKQTKQSFFKRPRLFGTKDRTVQVPSVPQAVSPEIVRPPPMPTAEFHVLLRGHHPNEVLSLQLEREIDDQHDTRESIACEVRQLLDEISGTKASFITSPHGDEEWNGAGFGLVPEIGEGEGFGGGGFHVLSCWAHWRDALRDCIVSFETDMRAYLTGVQATSREQLGTLVASNVRPGLLQSGAASSTHTPIFSRENMPVRAAAIVLVRASLTLCGYKKEVAIESSAEKDDDLLKEYLRANAGRKLLDLNPKTTAKWTVALRASNYIKTKFGPVSRLGVAPDAEAIRAARTLFLFMSALVSAVKYFKFIQDNAKQRKQRIDCIATRIQCFYRVVLARKLLRRLRNEFAAALRIQCAFRQHLARRRRAFLKWDRAARTVQRAYRRKLAQRRGRRPRKLTLELRTVAAQYGTMQTGHIGGTLTASDEGDDAWKVEMTSFDSFKSYLDSRVGRDQLKREERVISERLKEVARHREQTLAPHDRLLADAYDIFELLDVEGGGELSRERTQELMTRLHIPLSGEEAADVIDMMDNDRSGAISFGEFTRWFTHELDILKKRNRECGVLSKRDRQWVAEESARSALRKRWRAHQSGASSPIQKRPQESAQRSGTDAGAAVDLQQESKEEN